MPFFKGGQSIPPSSHLQRNESFPAPPAMFGEDDVFEQQTPATQPPKKELNASAKRFARRAGKESGLKKLMRRHSSKLPSEVRSPSPPSPQLNGSMRNGHYDSYSGARTLDKRTPTSGGSGSKVTFAATLQQDIHLENPVSGSKKSSKSAKRSKSISLKMPLHSALKNSSISSNSSFQPPPTYADYGSHSNDNGWISSHTLGKFLVRELSITYFFTWWKCV